MDKSYQKLRKKLRAQTRKSRDREIRVKVELILLAHRLGNVSEACARRGFSRGFYYKWWGRLKRAKFNIQSLSEKSRRPKRSPNKKSIKIDHRIFYYNKLGYGARMIQEILRREKIDLAKSTICHILNHRRKSKKVRKNRLKAHRKRYELLVPGQRLQLDVKYVPEFVGGFRVFNYVAVDECTRWRYSRGYLDIGPKSTVDFLMRLKKACPFPIHCIQTDNGFEFTYRLVPNNDTLHPMDEWCDQNAVKHRCIPPGEKELNGKVERSHRIDEQYFYWQAPTSNLEAFNRDLNRWLTIYNVHRPHGGLSYQTPLEKLSERYRSLSQTKLDSSLEFLRLRFLKSIPKSYVQEQQRDKKVKDVA